MADWRVLVVEDDRRVASIHCRHVSRQPGFSVVGVAGSSAEALALVPTLRPHLALLDLGLPGENGLALLRALRQAREPIEVIVITAHAEGPVVRSALQLGVVDYLVKPFWPARLSEALAAFETRMESVREGRLSQASVDRAMAASAGRPESAGPALSHERIREVKAALTARGEAMSAQDVAAATGMARVTARRYLEHLVALGQCTVDELGDGPGRPRKMYRPWLSGPVADLGTAAAKPASRRT